MVRAVYSAEPVSLIEVLHSDVSGSEIVMNR